MAAAKTADIIAFVKGQLNIDEKLGTKVTIERAEEDLGMPHDGTIIERARKLLSELGGTDATVAGMAQRLSTKSQLVHSVRDASARTMRTEQARSTTELMLTAHMPTTLGDALNSLLCMLAFGLHVGAKISLPWLPRSQFHVASPTWFTELGGGDDHAGPKLRSDGLSWSSVLDLKGLRALPLQLGPDETYWASIEHDAFFRRNSTRVGLTLFKRSLHWIPPELYAPSVRQTGTMLQCNTFRWPELGGTGETHCVPRSRWQVHLPWLNQTAAFDALHKTILELQAAYRGPAPMLVLYRNDGELSCVPWAMTREMLSVVRHLELTQPPLPPNTTAAAAGAELALARRCAYSFWRFMPHVWETVQQRGNETKWSVTPSNTEATIYNFNLKASVHLALRRVADGLAAAMRQAGTDCIYLDVKGDASSLREALSRRGVRTIALDLPAQYNFVPLTSGPRPHWNRPPMVANVLKLFYARHAKLFICEAGSQWCDVPTMLRTRDGQPTLITSGSANALLFEEAHRVSCVRIRGRCVDPGRLPYRENSGAC